jgi:hypothetical protein
VSRRPRLTHHGVDVELRWRTAEGTGGRAMIWYLDREGNPTGRTNRVWPHELRGTGWHLAEIKTLVSSLPLYGSRPAAAAPAPIADPEPVTAGPRGFLHSHFSAPKD